jgi:hypothetical protein
VTLAREVIHFCATPYLARRKYVLQPAGSCPGWLRQTISVALTETQVVARGSILSIGEDERLKGPNRLVPAPDLKRSQRLCKTLTPLSAHGIRLLDLAHQFMEHDGYGFTG